MFEAHVLHLLRRYLGEYVQGLSLEALRISVWKGDVVLKDLKLKTEALNSLRLPVTVKAGFVGTITLKNIHPLEWILILGKKMLLEKLMLEMCTLAEDLKHDLATWRTMKTKVGEAKSANLEAIKPTFESEGEKPKQQEEYQICRNLGLEGKEGTRRFVLGTFYYPSNVEEIVEETKAMERSKSKWTEVGIKDQGVKNAKWTSLVKEI